MLYNLVITLKKGEYYSAEFNVKIMHNMFVEKTLFRSEVQGTDDRQFLLSEHILCKKSIEIVKKFDCEILTYLYVFRAPEFICAIFGEMYLCMCVCVYKCKYVCVCACE